MQLSSEGEYLILYHGRITGPRPVDKRVCPALILLLTDIWHSSSNLLSRILDFSVSKIWKFERSSRSLQELILYVISILRNENISVFVVFVSHYPHCPAPSFQLLSMSRSLMDQVPIILYAWRHISWINPYKIVNIFAYLHLSCLRYLLF